LFGSKFIKDIDRFKKLEQSKIRRDELQYLWKHLHEKNMKTELVYVTDNDVDEYESSEVKVVGKEQVYQILWERIKKPAKGEKSSLSILKCLEHDNALCCIVSAFDYADLVERMNIMSSSQILENILAEKDQLTKELQKLWKKIPTNSLNGIMGLL